MNIHSVKVETTAHYYTLGKLNKNTKEVWVVCHGYGQLAKFFLKKFTSLERDDVCIIAPEGFNKFYLKGFSGRVGASWMTKENRDDEIIDHCNFIEQIIDEALNKASKNCTLNVLGFSQGTATVSRWSLITKHTIHTFILWAGKIADDFNYKKYKTQHSRTSNYIVFGTADEFYTGEFVEKYKLEVTNLNAKWLSYEGGHVIDAKTLERINANIPHHSLDIVK